MQQTIILILDFPMQPFIIHFLMHAHAYGASNVWILIRLDSQPIH